MTNPTHIFIYNMATITPYYPPGSLPTRQLEGGEREEVLPFFWLDAYEDSFHQPGTVYLIGKVWVEQANAYVR